MSSEAGQRSPKERGPVEHPRKSCVSGWRARRWASREEDAGRWASGDGLVTSAQSHWYERF